MGVNENRRNAAQYVGAGAALLAASAGGNELLNTRLKRRMPDVKRPGVIASAARSVAGRPNGFVSGIHVPHIAGKAGVRGAQVSALPLLAAGVKRFVTGEDTRKLDVKSDVVRPVVEHATYQDQVRRGDKSIAKAKYDPFSRSWSVTKPLLADLNRTKARDVRTGAGAKKFVAENRHLASFRHGNKLEVIRPDMPSQRLRMIDSKYVYRYNPRGEAEGFKKSLTESDTKRLDRHKKAGTLLSLSSGTLGLAALGTRAPAVARSLNGKGVKGLSRLASHEAKATSLSNTLGVTALGVGSAGSFNYAAQQRLERKRDAVSKAQIIPGIYRPIMHISEETNKLETSRPVVDALRARLKGAPVYHGGTSARVNNLRRGKSVDMKTHMFGDKSVKGLWTTPRRDMASQYAVSGRTPENFHKYGEETMSSEAVARTKKGKVAEYNMKGVWPEAGWVHEDKSAFVYKPEDLDGRLVRVHGQKRTRDAETRLRGTEDVSRQSTFNQSGVGKSMPTYGWLKRTGEKVRIMRPHGTSGHFLVDSPRGTLIAHRDEMRFAPAKQTRLSPASQRATSARAKQPEQLSMFEKSFLSRYGDRISPNAEAGYRHLRTQRNENVASAIGNGSLAGLSAGVLAHEGRHMSRPAAGLTAAGGLAAAYSSLNGARTAKRRQISMKKIEQKAHARAVLGLYGPDRGKSPVDMTSARAKKSGAAS